MSGIFQRLCIDNPLYLTVKLDHVQSSEFLGSKGHIDCFCEQCGCSSTYSLVVANRVNFKRDDDRNVDDSESLRYISFFCSRVGCSETAVFIFRLRIQPTDENMSEEIRECLLSKIGQSPSLLDNRGLKQSYAKILGADGFGYLKKAHIQTSHGYGIGAIAYLRRVFEMIVSLSVARAIEKGELKETDLEGKRMSEKISLLRGNLPPLVIENKDIYGRLSESLHALSEEECLAYFIVLSPGIELILEDELSRHTQEQKRKEFEKALKSMKKSTGEPNG